MSDDLLRVMDAGEARRLTERIRLTATTFAESREKLMALVTEAKDGHAHIALGYGSWTDYLSDVLGEEPLRLARDDRRELVTALAAEGMSTRAIAPIVGASRQTVANDLEIPMFKTKAQMHDPVSVVSAAPSVSYIDVNPAIAERWLAQNTVNRTVRESKVRQYASDMRAGRWTHSADMICFSPDGLLLNGQHRLHAVVVSGCTITFAVQRNTPHEAMQNLDTGSARTVADVLGWRDEKSASLLGAASKLVILYRDGRIYKDNKAQAVSHGEIVDFVDFNPGIRESVAVGQATGHHVDCMGSVLSAAHFIIAEANDVDAATEFMHRLAFRTGEPAGSPVLALDKRLREIRKNRQTYSRREFLALVIKAWNFDARGQSASKLSITQRGAFAIPAPTVRRSA